MAIGGPPMRPDTLCRISSTTKPITAAVVLSLVDDGVLDLNGPVEGPAASTSRPPGAALPRCAPHRHGTGRRRERAACGDVIAAAAPRLNRMAG